MYNNPYGYNPQATRDRIDNQIAQLQQLKEQVSQPIQQPTSLTQNFQLAPNQSGMKYANSMDDVQKEVVYVDTPFFSNDLSVVWIKNAKGNIKPYEMREIVQKDEKDMLIESLQYQINELKGMIANEQSNNANVDEPIENEKSTIVSTIRKTKK